jgi:hypothetical protein
LSIRGKHLSNPVKYSNRIKSFIRTKKGKRSSQTQVKSDSYFSCCFPFKKKAAAELISSEGGFPYVWREGLKNEHCIEKAWELLLPT